MLVCCLVLCAAVYFDPGPVYTTLDVPTYHFIAKKIEEITQLKPVPWEFVCPAADMYTQFVTTSTVPLPL